jgi:threonine dehydratase
MQHRLPSAAGTNVLTQRPVVSRPVVRDFVDGVITVNEAEIVNAMRLCYERMKVNF